MDSEINSIWIEGSRSLYLNTPTIWMYDWRLRKDKPPFLRQNRVDIAGPRFQLAVF